jgi:hypothetical protein
VAESAFELLGEDESAGVDGNGAEGIERGGDLFGRALARERSSCLGFEELDEIVGSFGETSTQEVGRADGDVDAHTRIEQTERKFKPYRHADRMLAVEAQPMCVSRCRRGDLNPHALAGTRPST